tara:strand:- start:502 stop:612 length:111 start_codon:yes stop_codon:yes gene_type:complete
LLLVEQQAEIMKLVVVELVVIYFIQEDQLAQDHTVL